MGDLIDSIAALEALYGDPAPASLTKVARRLTPTYRRWIEASRLCVLSSVGPEGTDGTPRGDDGPVAVELDPGTLAVPDWHGNNRVDTLRNIVIDGRVSLMFMVPGSNNVVRINGRAHLSRASDLLARFERKGRLPRSVIVIAIDEIYVQCARALLRAGLWSGEAAPAGLPSVGDILAEMSQGREGGAAYDLAWDGRARDTLW